MLTHYSNISKLKLNRENKSMDKEARKLLLEARTYTNEDLCTSAISCHELETAIRHIDGRESSGGDLIFEALREYVNLNDAGRARKLVIFCDSKAALEAILQGRSRLKQIVHRLLDTITGPDAEDMHFTVDTCACRESLGMRRLTNWPK
ncbi:hypothetical protein NPIL_468671 [Nephila pilipes]|uniref:Uncharacterized protein n=1 Tax=Nephila pilipes TaxID=299642 RepID=A0A8X6QMZ2_NEPPI|nr:hypothetical protein NPIL_468671 [Nephila pilipes]